MMPVGVHGSGAGSPSTSEPRFIGCSPSTSFTGSTAVRISNSAAVPNPVGTCTRKAVHAGSALSPATMSSTSALAVPVGRSWRMLATPISAESLCLALTYQMLPGSSPTSTVPSPGTTPRSASAATRCASSCLIVARTLLPSRSRAVTSSHPASRGRSADDHSERPDQQHGVLDVDAGAAQVRPAGVEALQPCAAEIGVAQHGVAEPHPAQVRVGERGAGQVGVDEVRLGQPAARQVALAQQSATERRAGQVALAELGAAQVGVEEVAAGEPAPVEHRAAEPRVAEAARREARPLVTRRAQHGAMEVARDEAAADGDQLVELGLGEVLVLELALLPAFAGRVEHQWKKWRVPVK